MDLKNLQTTKQVAKILGCTARNVAFMVKAEKLNPIMVLENGSFLFDVSDVELYKLNNEKA